MNCGYCAISRDYVGTPDFYPTIKELSDKEMTPEEVIEILDRFKKHNRDCFHIFYGGEPFLFKGLEKVIDHCNKNEIAYTVITNGSDLAKRRLSDMLMKGEIDHLEGLTCSIDPPAENKIIDVNKKSNSGLKFLIEFKDIAKDLVAEVTLTTKNMKNTILLLQTLTNHGIYASLTSIDIKMNECYDFSNIYPDEDYLVLQQNKETRNLFNEILDRKDLLVHMRKVINDFYYILPRSMCDMHQENIHNVTVDADGGLRLCLRIRGKFSPQTHIKDFIDENGNLLLSQPLKDMNTDRSNMCLGCNWTCRLFSRAIEISPCEVGNLLHSKERGLSLSERG